MTDDEARQARIYHNSIRNLMAACALCFIGVIFMKPAAGIPGILLWWMAASLGYGMHRAQVYRETITSTKRSPQ